MEEKHLYRFGAFALRADKSVLDRDGKAVPLTPKMFDTLFALVRRHGEVVDKDTLLKEVWPDSFVEEGNIAFNIRQIRKALGDDAQAPTYIETVPRRGYRFIAEVEENEKPAIGSNGTNGSAVDGSAASHESSKTRLSYILVAVFALIFFAAVTGIWFSLGTESSSPFPVLNSPFASEKLSTTGMVYAIAISPDGKTAVYSTRNKSKQSVWLRELDSANNVQIIPPSEEDYYEFAFAADGNSIYFTRGTRGIEKHIDIFRISVRGGVPEKVADNTEGTVSVSSDGQKISFARCPRREDEWCSLWIADAKDGQNERKLVSRRDPYRIGDSEISPDGTRVAFAVGQSRNSANDFHLAEFDLTTGTEREITPEKFFNIKSLAWLPDQSGLLMTASRVPNKYFRVWQVSTTSRKAEPLTKDSEAYGVVSLDDKGDRLISTQIKQDFRLHIFDIERKAERRFLADAARASFSPDGKLYFASNMSGNDEIWSINPDASGQRQLTTDSAGDGGPIPSHDGRTVFFASNRSGEAHVWRMNSDGSGQTQITHTGGGAPIFAAADGKTLYYRNAIKGNLWSVSLETGEEKLVLAAAKPFFAFSPDASTVAFEETSGNDRGLVIASVRDGRRLNRFELPKEKIRLLEFVWMPDARSILYLMSDVEYQKNSIYQQPIDGGPVRKVIDLPEEQLNEAVSLTISPDGKNFALVQGGWKHDAVLITGLK